ncbi:MAG: hypothetical protein CSH36_07945 [Thalassolituus sp.]|jgi:hypothetical protein|nr:MAG: hypothetical protein CSH36_07945 [Thalassolituus sp.]
MKILICSALLLSATAVATPRPMMMLDDSTLSNTRVDYLTGLEQQRTNEETGKEESETGAAPKPDVRSELPVVTPASIPTSIPLPSKGVSVQITPR